MQVCCHPIDTVKTRMQIKEPQKKLKKWRKKVSKNSIGIGPLDIDNWFFKGPGDVYRGVMGAILGTAANAFLYFVCYEGEEAPPSSFLFHSFLPLSTLIAWLTCPLSSLSLPPPHRFSAGAKRKLEKHLSPEWVHIASASIGIVAASVVRVGTYPPEV